MMRITVSPSRDHLRRMKKAHVYRAQLKQTATASGRSSSPAHGRSSAVHADESGIRPLVANRGRVSK